MVGWGGVGGRGVQALPVGLCVQVSQVHML